MSDRSPAEARGGSGATALPSVSRMLVDQIRYHARLMLAGGRATMIGVGLPVLLLITSSAHGHVPAPAVAQRAAFGVTIMAFMTYGVRLVAARESGILKRWRATPVPRSCFFLGRIIATVLVATFAGAITVVVAMLLYHTHLTVVGALGLLIAFALGAAAWAALATVLTTVISTVESASPMLMVVYFPVIIISGAFGQIDEPHWLHVLAGYVPAQPLIHTATAAILHARGTPVIGAHDLIVLLAWTVLGLVTATCVFRWEPHRSTHRRAARSA